MTGAAMKTMNQEKIGRAEIQRTTKRSYLKPAFLCERIFGTKALSCYKISTTQSQCAHNRKSF